MTSVNVLVRIKKSLFLSADERVGTDYVTEGRGEAGENQVGAGHSEAVYSKLEVRLRKNNLTHQTRSACM